MNVRRRTILTIVAMLALVPMLASAQPITPPTISYQGRITFEGAPYDGPGLFKFAILNGGGEVTWSNDATPDGQPEEPVELVVTEGLFGVGLGDEGLGMLPLGPDAFNDSTASLRVWFSPDGGEFFRLEPDRPLSSVPYAYVAEYASVANDADTVDGQHASAFAGAAHNHLNQTWSGSGMGLVVNSSTNLGVEGESGAAYEQTMFGEVVKPGLLGTASVASGKAVGVHGRATNSAGGIGVYGSAQITGTVGMATSASGRTRGLYGESVSPLGAGVYGKDGATSGGATGVAGESDSPTGAGVAGYADHTSGANYGVYGITQSRTGYGVYGLAQASSGATYGLYGKASSPFGRGAYGEGASIGVHGFGSGTETIGVLGEVGSSQGVGVQGTGSMTGTVGIATHASGATVGVYGKTNSTSLGTAGVYGESPSIGVYGKGTGSGRTYGVYGYTESPAGYAVFSEGDAHVAGNLTWQPKTSYLSVAPADFVPRKKDIDYINRGHSLVHSPGDTIHPSNDPLDWKWFYAPVSLPHGASIVSITLYMQNGERPTVETGEDRFDVIGQLRFFRSRVADQDVDLLAELEARGAFSAEEFIMRSASLTPNLVVDNSQCVYFVKFTMLPLNATTEFHGVIIEYQTSAPH